MHASEVFALYRSHIRQTRSLPHHYLRQFFSLRAADDFRKVLQTKDVTLRRKKVKRLSKGLKTLTAANGGDYNAFNRILDVAYGRIGRLRWELMQPWIDQDYPNPPAPIIAGKEKSRPPVFSPALRALQLSNVSRKTRPLTANDIKTPPTLPEHANPQSEDALFLGPFSKRREVNLRWRYFTRESKKIYPPLEVAVEGEDPSAVRTGTGLEGTGILQEAIALATWPQEAFSASSNHSPRPLPFDGHLPIRWLRRRYQELLKRMPVISYLPGQNSPTPRWTVSPSHPGLQTINAPILPAVHRQWIDFARSVEMKETNANSQGTVKGKAIRREQTL
ncbi:hypothetical protein CONPUDRAFT_44195 [Coniophora puteana RWD-64-598 SS2]|uniref:LYR motif-containing protein Cup1-like N-terminal domain-containing protein n=1 Tax=Coniophora puteana (strain RWD-64-598) TaxID=741705 RepID=A0A5M3N644_CONPW|nr:uncharacterized protein CONPUDRAFT_44195 [Coniophora puteana RWD-64-598 SS2]EIW86883.1 hypothetical protein CONPUDRAFT_44195 [Coniophora puteana RWD-64-598 SS2]